MKKILFTFVLLGLLAGCAGIPVRKALKEDIGIPAGKIEGNQFTGIRYPFGILAPPHWKVTMEFPDFLEEMGYVRPSPTDREQTELYIFDPETKSSVQFDFTPADRYSVFSQERIERLTTAAAGTLKAMLAEEYGNEFQVDVSPTTPYPLKGVQYGAKKYGTYTIKGIRREQGWIYGFNEPYHIFILYQVIEKGGVDDRQDIKKILDSFEVFSKK